MNKQQLENELKMFKSGKELEFISSINRDGSGTTPISESYLKMLKQEEFEVVCISMSEKTYIAHGFNAFVVKLK